MNFIKKSGKVILCVLLENQSKRLRKKKDFKIVAVVGSVGKTSTKLAIAKVVGSSSRVRHQEGNYNDRLTVPLVLFGHVNPGLFNLFAWIKILISNEIQIGKIFPYDIVVLELGTDGPGQIAEFAYLRPDISVVTATTPEHMEFFGSVEEVAKEELSVADFSSKIIINTDDVPEKFLHSTPKYLSYGLGADCSYRAKILRPINDTIQSLQFLKNGEHPQSIQLKLLGKQGAKVALASYAVATELGLDDKATVESIGKLTAFNGRMNLLDGIKNSTIIDDTYNSSPAAVIAALDVLYDFEASQRIALLGNMNELGETSKASHMEIGSYCDPKKLDLVITIGPDANEFTAKSAERNGCTVIRLDSPYEAGKYIKSKLKSGAVVLAKGSQNRVFAEESLKILLSNPSDQSKLVRQTDFWLNIKKQQFLTDGDK